MDSRRPPTSSDPQIASPADYLQIFIIRNCAQNATSTANSSNRAARRLDSIIQNQRPNPQIQHQRPNPAPTANSSNRVSRTLHTSRMRNCAQNATSTANPPNNTKLGTNHNINDQLFKSPLPQTTFISSENETCTNTNINNQLARTSENDDVHKTQRRRSTLHTTSPAD